MRKIVFISGSMRSGSSAWAGVFQKLGYQLHDDLLEPDEVNPRGYFESHAVVNLNDRILAHLGTTWDQFLPIRQRSIHSLPNEIINEMMCLIEDTVDVIKDPRFSILLPLWVEAARMVERDPVVIVPLRNPSDVIASLMRLNSSFSPNKSALYLLNALRQNMLGVDEANVQWCPLAFEALDRAQTALSRVTDELGVPWVKGVQYSDHGDFVDQSVVQRPPATIFPPVDRGVGLALTMMHQVFLAGKVHDSPVLDSVKQVIQSNLGWVTSTEGLLDYGPEELKLMAERKALTSTNEYREAHKALLKQVNSA